MKRSILQRWAKETAAGSAEALSGTTARFVISVVQGFLVFGVLAGCNSITPPATVHQPMTARSAPQRDVLTNQGSIYQPDNTRSSLFDDRRAFFVGDTIAVVIEEKTSVSK